MKSKWAGKAMLKGSSSPLDVSKEIVCGYNVMSNKGGGKEIDLSMTPCSSSQYKSKQTQIILRQLYTTFQK